MQQPEYIICTHAKPEPHSVEFSELFAQREDIKKMIMLWDSNSYLVDVILKSFLINGGRRLSLLDHFPGRATVLYARRNRQEISLNSDEKGRASISYLLGLKGEDGKELILHISPDGKAFSMIDHR